MGKSKIFVDGNCVVCDLEVAHYKRIAPDQFDLVDISDEAFDPKAYGFDRARVNKHLHVLTADGQVKVGVEAFVQIWSQIPKYAWMSRVAHWPGVRQAAQAGYEVFAVVRPWLPKRK